LFRATLRHNEGRPGNLLTHVQICTDLRDFHVGIWRDLATRRDQSKAALRRLQAEITECVVFRQRRAPCQLSPRCCLARPESWQPSPVGELPLMAASRRLADQLA
jgi:hypothetical protein